MALRGNIAPLPRILAPRITRVHEYRLPIEAIVVDAAPLPRILAPRSADKHLIRLPIEAPREN